MKRKILLVIGKSDLFKEGEYSFKTEELVEALKKRNDIELVIVGDYKAEKFDYSSLSKSILELKEGQPITIIMQTHGSFENDAFEFVVDKDSNISSKDLFTTIVDVIPSTPVDIFTPTCHGGGMLFDRDILPLGSTLVTLTDKNDVNNGHDFAKIAKYIEDYNADLSAYNLLQLYLSKCLKSRFHPHIARSNCIDLSLDDMLKLYISNPIKFDVSHYNLSGCQDEYKDVFNKIVSSKSEWSIYASEYGIALSIILNDMEKKRIIDKVQGRIRRF